MKPSPLVKMARLVASKPRVVAKASAWCTRRTLRKNKVGGLMMVACVQQCGDVLNAYDNGHDGTLHDGTARLLSNACHLYATYLTLLLSSL